MGKGQVPAWGYSEGRPRWGVSTNRLGGGCYPWAERRRAVAGRLIARRCSARDWERRSRIGGHRASAPAGRACRDRTRLSTNGTELARKRPPHRDGRQEQVIRVLSARDGDRVGAQAQVNAVIFHELDLELACKHVGKGRIEDIVDGEGGARANGRI